MAARQIVSYDDLYSDNEVEEATGGDAKTGAAASSTPEIHGDQQSASSCTSASEAEDEDDPSNILARPGAWDDSELIRAWDSAIDDYRKHHSSMLNDDEQRTEFHKHESKVGGWTPVLEEGSGSGQPGRKRRRGAEEQSRAASEKCTDVENSGYVHEQASWAGAAGAAGAQELGDSWAMNPAPPTSEKDALHRLNMSWYYAGYYAGYYQAYRSGIGSGDPQASSEAAEASDEKPGSKEKDESLSREQTAQ